MLDNSGILSGDYAEVYASMDADAKARFNKAHIKELVNFNSVEPVKVSIIVPNMNNERYLRECLSSIVDQSLKEIEIIVMDDGSSDSSIDIEKEFAAKDPRVKIVIKENSGYGHSMNIGMDLSCGEYIGIVESDDYVELDMYETLYNEAVNNDVDVCKADFNRFLGEENDRTFIYERIAKKRTNYNVILDPSVRKDVFDFGMNTWSGIYRRSFLNDNHIRHNETPGASFQDNGLYFMAFACSHRVLFIDRAFYNNRRDNENSSVMSTKKVFCMKDEYDRIESLLKEKNLSETFLKTCVHKRFSNYMFTLSRIGDADKAELLKVANSEFKEYHDKGLIDESLFGKNGLVTLRNVFMGDYVNAHLDDPKVKVSVIMPVSEELDSSDSIESVLMQSLKGIEVMLVPIGGLHSDQILDIVKNDTRVSILEPADDISGAWNRGVEKSSGEFITFLRSDERYPVNDVLFILYMTATNNRSLACAGSYGVVDENNNPVSSDKHPFGFRFEEEGEINYSEWQFCEGLGRFLISRNVIIDSGIEFSDILDYSEAEFIMNVMNSVSTFHTIPKLSCVGPSKVKSFTDGVVSDVLAGAEKAIKTAFDLGFYKSAFVIVDSLNTEQLDGALRNKSSEYYRVLSKLASIQAMLFDVDNNDQWILKPLESMLGAGPNQKSEEIEKSAWNPKEGPYKVTVVMPIFNVDRYLNQCMDSVVQQTLKEIEIICVDDGSTDSSYDILTRYARDDPRVILIKQDNSGAAIARNKGLAIARGEYIAFLDSDDYYDSTLLEKLYNKCKKYACDVGICSCQRFDQSTGNLEYTPWFLNRSIIPKKEYFSLKEIADHAFTFDVGWPWDKLFRTEFVKSKGFKFQDIRSSNDALFVFMSSVSATRVTVVDEVLATHRVNTKTSLSQTRKVSTHSFFEAIKEIKASLVKNGLWDTYRKGFINWATGFTVWHYVTLDEESRNETRMIIRDEVCKEIEFDTLPREEFIKKKEYDVFASLLEPPYNSGTNAPSDFDNSIEWYRKAVEQDVEWARKDLFEILWKLNTPETDAEAANVIMPLAEIGDAEAEFKLARAYEEGRGVESDRSKATYLYKLAISDGYDRARISLFDILWKERSPDADKEAVSSIGPLIEMGDGQAMLRMGNALRHGRGVQRDKRSAADYYSRALSQGISSAIDPLCDTLWDINTQDAYSEAMSALKMRMSMGDGRATFKMAQAFRSGRGVKKDKEKCKELLRKSNAQGFTKAAYELFDVLWTDKKPESDQEAVCIVSSLSADMDAQATLRLGKATREGRGVQRDLNRAAELFEEAYSLGSDGALAECYDTLMDIGTPDSLSKAIEIAEKSAEEGAGWSMGRLARAYRYGKGVEVNIDESIEWYRKAIAQGVSWAPNELFDMFWEIGTPKAYRDAFSLASASAKENNGGSMGRLARAYRDGKGIRPDVKKSVEWYRKAIAQGVSWAPNELFDVLWDLNSEDYSKEAFQIASSYANKGNPGSMGRLARCYRDGKGTEKDLAKAAEWYRKATKNGLSWASKELSEVQDAQTADISKEANKASVNINADAKDNQDVSENATIVKKDSDARSASNINGKKPSPEDKLYRLADEYRKSAKLGQSGAEKKLCSILIRINTTDSLREAYDVMTKMADAGDKEAQYEMGKYCRDGIGTEKNLEKSVEWFRLAADAGHLNANYELASILYNGKSTEERSESINRFTIAAESGDKDSAFKLSHIYADGKICPEDASKHRIWLEKSAEYGHNGAKTELAQILIKESRTEEAFRLLCEASKSGNARAELVLGRMYRDGNGVDKDLSVAAEHMRKASANGIGWAESELMIVLWEMNDPKCTDEMISIARRLEKKKDYRAIGILGRAYRDGRGVDKDQKKALAYLRAASENGVVWAKNDYKALRAEKPTSIKKEDSTLESLWRTGRHKSLLILAQKQAESGDLEAKAYLGRLYREGSSVEKDLDKAESLLLDSSENGIDWAQNELLEVLWEKGDYERAIGLAEKYLDAGNTGSAKILGRAYGTGTGVEKDPSKAEEYYRRASSVSEKT